MSVTYLIGTAEVLRSGDAGEGTESLGPNRGPTANARTILADLTGQTGAKPALVEAFVLGVLGTPEAAEQEAGRGVVEVTEKAIDEWAGKFGLTIGKRGVRGL